MCWWNVNRIWVKTNETTQCWQTIPSCPLVWFFASYEESCINWSISSETIREDRPFHISYLELLEVEVLTWWKHLSLSQEKGASGTDAWEGPRRWPWVLSCPTLYSARGKRWKETLGLVLQNPSEKYERNLIANETINPLSMRFCSQKPFGSHKGNVWATCGVVI